MNYPYFNPYQPNMQQPVQQPMQQPMQQTQSGFVSVHSEEEALRYPIAPGNSITFKIEGQPILIEKTMGFSQLDSPRVERFKITREGAPEESPRYAMSEDIGKIKDALSTDIENVRSSLAEDMEKIKKNLTEEIDMIEEELEKIRTSIPKRRRTEDE